MKTHCLTMGSRAVRYLIWGLSVAFLLPLSIHASVLVQSSFDAGFGTGALGAQPGIQGSANDIGFSGNYIYSPCAADSGGGGYFNIIPATGTFNLSYTVSGGGSIPSGVNAVDLKTSCISAGTSASRPLGTSITGQDVYASIVVKPIAAGGSSSTDLIFTLGAGSASSPFFGIMNQKAAAGLYGVYSSSTASSTTSVTSSIPYLLVAQFVWNASTSKYDTVKLWLNPTASSAGTPNATVTDTAHAFASFNAVGLFTTNMTTNSEYAFDSLVIGTT
jgi:hypothetical protein